MASMVSASFEHHFQDLPDPRIEHARKHPLINIVFVAVCGVLCGANSFAGIHEFAIDRRNWLARYLDLTNGIPSEDTFAPRLGPSRSGGVREVPVELGPGRAGGHREPAGGYRR